ncbi:hypothetical protein [Paraburkholderia caballeronis]|uniref:hypothetical protein n=1 Tax=Paraburkholderia caballeronis TaxID=416943 RepID=UPI0010668C0D|nr:hypothetical protein [Paraburkholderia caballeronis]TDV04688.1 hypothetical protein C7408_13150 [Paraburkholderia caballeronis]TDV07931.1 hypothetical protein C7406_13350 [Paraburkholderia caballeronis]TDV18222.1 hypothetical protein C7404_13150 [Paraburkholderia caballeronis]
MAKHEITIGDKTLPVAPASLKTIKRWLKAQQEVRVGTLEYMDELSEFIYAALARATPDLDRDWLEGHLDETNIPLVISKVYEAGKLQSGEVTGRQEG